MTTTWKIKFVAQRWGVECLGAYPLSAVRVYRPIDCCPPELRHLFALHPFVRPDGRAVWKTGLSLRAIDRIARANGVVRRSIPIVCIADIEIEGSLLPAYRYFVESVTALLRSMIQMPRERLLTEAAEYVGRRWVKR